MLKLLFLLLLPGLFAGYICEDVGKRCGNSLWKYITNSFLFSYILFLIDATVIFAFYSEKYADFLSFCNRRMCTVEEFALFTLCWLMQLLITYGMGIGYRIIRNKGIERAFLRMTALQKNVSFVMMGTSLVCVLICFVIKDNAEQGLVINEVCSKNDNVITDKEGNYSDYIELYNSSGWDILLKDFCLSDNPEQKNCLVLDGVVIPAKGYYLVWVGTKEDDTDSFGISFKGETIYLESPGGEVLDMVTIPELDRNVAYARITDGADEWQEEVPSPSAANNNLKKYLDKPLFSQESGFYDEAFFLSISAGEGEKIYYTLDGSTPDESSYLYTEEILVENVSGQPNVYRSIRNVVENWETYTPPANPVDKAVIVRAVAVDESGNTSDVVTKAYFVDMEQYKDKYVLSLVSDPEDLFGDNGIYVTGWEYEEWYAGDRGPANILANYRKTGREYEIECSLTLLKNTLLMEQNVGLRIQGGSARHNAIKRFSIYARKEYSGSKYFNYDLFGKDTHSMFTRAEFADVIVHSLVKDRNIGTQDAVPAVIFVDGEYWYEWYLREKYSEEYLATVYGVKSDDVQIVESMPWDIYDFLSKHDLSQEEAYKQFCEMVDIQSYIDYMVVSIYACNMDASEAKNCRMWRTVENAGTAYGDGKWRWLLYDADSLVWNSIGYYQAEKYQIDSFAQNKQYAGVAFNQETVYKALRGNEEFCKEFVLTFMDLVNTNFAYENVREQMTKWGYDMSWNDSFFEKRDDYIVPALAKEFELQGTLEEITISVNDIGAGYVQVNTITPELAEGNFRGYYYTDYPITITAVANGGYEFVGWRCGEELIQDVQIEVQLTEGGCQWEAVFE